MPLVRALVAVFALFIAANAPVAAQCTPGWSADLGTNGFNSSAHASVVFDDGSGPALYVGGSFTSVGGVLASRIARFDGSTWSPVGSGMDNVVGALAVYDDGQGPKLYAGGQFTTAGGVAARMIARWNGVSWETVGPGLDGDEFTAVSALHVYTAPDGQTSLYAGGAFTASGVPTRIARWNGSVWSSIGWIPTGNLGGMAVHDFDGAGPAPAELFALSHTGEAQSWNGNNWTVLPGVPGGFFFATFDLVSYDPPGQAGPWLVAGARSPQQVGNGVWAWDGMSWFELSGLSSRVHSLCVFDAGTGHGRALYAAHRLDPYLLSDFRRWTGSDWSVEAALHGVGASVTELVSAVAPSSRVSTLYALGYFDGVGGVASKNIAQWNGTAWSGVGAGGGGVDATISAFALHDDGSGPALFASEVTGNFPGSLSITSEVSKWNGATWTSVGASLRGNVTALVSFDDGSGPTLYAGGTLFDGTAHCSVVRWDGVSWRAPGNTPVTAQRLEQICVFDDGHGPALYAAAGVGGITIGSEPATMLARWDGVAWSAVPGARAPAVDAIESLGTYDDGNGEALYVSGVFTTIDGVAASNIAKWDGSQWSALGSGLNATATAFTVAYFGNRLELVVGGNFTAAGGMPAKYVARWNGSQWNALGAGPDAQVLDVCAFDDGAGSKLVASLVVHNGGVGPSPSLLVRWDGSAWTPVEGAMNGTPDRLKTFDDGEGEGAALWVSGNFTVVGEVASRHVARYVACTDPGRTFCFGDGSSTQCPCGNSAPLGTVAGCVNSLGEAPNLDAHGRASIANDGVRFDVAGLPPYANCLLVQGNALVNGGNGDMFCDGLSCAGGSIERIALRQASASGALSYPTAADLDVHVSGNVASPGMRAYQVYYRNSAPFCTSATFNLTNGFSVDWIP